MSKVLQKAVSAKGGGFYVITKHTLCNMGKNRKYGGLRDLTTTTLYHCSYTTRFKRKNEFTKETYGKGCDGAHDEQP